MPKIDPSLRQKPLLRQFMDSKILLLMCLPAIVFFIVFNYMPLPGVWIAFTNFNYRDGIFGSPFVGFKNFEFLIMSGQLWTLTRNTILYNLAFIILGNILQIAIAIMLNEIRSTFFKKVSQAAMFLPFFISAVLVGVIAFNLLNYDTGAINARSTLTTRTLQRFENQALLTVLEQTVNNSSEMTPTHLKPFGAPTIRRFVGSVTTKGKRTTFDLADAGEKVTLECEMGNVNAAAATAVRASSRKGGCNGDRGHWVPSTMKRVEALRCGIEREAASIDSPDRREEMAFAAPPGIEFLFVNDDCVMQGGGYRFVPPDSAVGPIRPPGG